MGNKGRQLNKLAKLLKYCKAFQSQIFKSYFGVFETKFDDKVQVSVQSPTESMAQLSFDCLK